MTRRTSQKEVVGAKGLVLLGIMGIIGLILLVLGVFLIYERFIFLGIVSLILGISVYFIFLLVEKKLKLL